MSTYFVSSAGSNTSPFDTEAKAATSLSTIAALPWLATDTVKVSSTHAESTAGSLNYTYPATPGLKIVSVTFNGSGTGALAVGGAITDSTNATAINFVSGYAYHYGITYNAPTGSSNSNIMNILSTAATSGMIFESCTFSLPGTGTSTRLNIGPASSNTDSVINLINCTVANGTVDRPINLKNGVINIEGLTLTGTAPTTVFALSTLDDGEFTLINSDISGVAWTNLVSVTAGVMAGFFRAINCKLRASFNVVTGTFTGPGSGFVEVIDCNSGDVNYYYRKECWEGTVTADNAVYYDAGNGTDSISWKMVSSANASYQFPLRAPLINFYNSTLSAMTTTVECNNDGTTFTDAELWQETLAKVTSGAPIGTWNRGDRVADILTAGANQTTSAVSWTGTGGWGAPVKQKLVSTSFTPDEVGMIAVQVKLAKASATVYVSPKVLTTSPRQVMGLGGTYLNESVVSTDPGIANVRLSTGYTINDSAKVGTAVIPSLANTKTGVAGDGGTGTYDGSDRWTDPGEVNTRTGTAYKANSTSNNKTGTCAVPTAANTIFGVAVDATTGTYVVVAITDVKSGVTYGPASSLTGTYEATGGGNYTFVS